MHKIRLKFSQEEGKRERNERDKGEKLEDKSCFWKLKMRVK